MNSKFLETFQPDKNNTKLSTNEIDLLSQYLPVGLIELYKQGGIGNYANGELKIIDPLVYHQNLMGWLMRDEPDFSRIPIALTSIGCILYYRKLDEDVEDISFIDPHTSEALVVTYSFDNLLEAFISDTSFRKDILDTNLFNKLHKKFGTIPVDDIYYFEPALRLGGTKSIENMSHGNALVHLDILLELALG